MRSLSAFTLLPLLVACAASSHKLPVTEAQVLSLARARTAAQCERHKLGCDAEALRADDGWLVSVTPVLGLTPDGEHLSAIHSGWNLAYSLTGRFKGDRGW